MTLNEINEKIQKGINLLKQENGRIDLAEESGILLNQLLGTLNQLPPPMGTVLLKEAVEQFININPGIRNFEIANELNICSYDNNGRNKNWFSWDILRLLLKDERIEKRGEEYYPVDNH